MAPLFGKNDGRFLTLSFQGDTVWWKPLNKKHRKIALELLATLLFGAATFQWTGSVAAAIAGSVLSFMFTFFCGVNDNVRQQFGGLYDLFVEFNNKLKPPTFCPALIEEAHTAMSAATDGIRQNRLHLLKNGGLPVNWREYADMLSSSLSFDEREFMATCTLTPVQFMGSNFDDYRGRQVNGLSKSWIPNRHFRVFIVNSQILTNEAHNPTNRNTLESFFEWHTRVRTACYFVSVKEFAETMTLHNDFAKLKLTDFVFFAGAEYSWIVGGEVDLTMLPVQVGATTTVHVIDQEVALHSVEHYASFAKALKKKALRPVKSLEGLRKWCERHQ